MNDMHTVAERQGPSSAPVAASAPAAGATAAGDPVLRWLSRVLVERYGLPVSLCREEAGCLSLRLEGERGRILFDRRQPDFFLVGADLPHGQWDAGAEGFRPPLGMPLPAPGDDGLPTPLVEQDAEGWVVHYDIPGLAYWMLSRQEEVDADARDRHGRFPASASHGGRHGYLDRPVVDEWLDILGQVMRRQWPGATLREHRFTTRPTHDVDRPSRYGFAGDLRLLRVMAGDTLRHRRPQALLLGPWVWLTTRRALHPLDPLNTFEWLMATSERHGLTSAFYFICGRTDPRLDADYEPEHPAIRDLLRRIHARGHEIGLHPSYHTYRNPKELANEADRLRRVCGEEGIEQATWGGRMHYLRWHTPMTLQGWQQAGMSYDSTLGYAETPGFRCGTCFEYPAFDPVRGEAPGLRIRPLIAMESSVIGASYLGLGTGEAAFERFATLKSRCRALGGSFTLLWHNSELVTTKQRALYERVLAA